MSVEYGFSFPGPQGIANATTKIGPATSAAGAGKFSVQVVIAGTAPATLKVDIEGSNDGGTTWSKLVTWDISSLSSGAIAAVKDIPVELVRLNLSTSTGGDATTKVSAYGAASR